MQFFKKFIFLIFCLSIINDKIQSAVLLNTDPLYTAVKESKLQKVETAISRLSEEQLTAKMLALTPDEPSKNETLLHLAAKEGSTTLVYTLVKKGAKLDALTTEGDSALAIAVKHGNTRIIPLILRLYKNSKENLGDFIENDLHRILQQVEIQNPEIK